MAPSFSSIELELLVELLDAEIGGDDRAEVLRSALRPNRFSGAE